MYKTVNVRLKVTINKCNNARDSIHKAIIFMLKKYINQNFEYNNFHCK
jgi:hypothetical protein